MKHVMLSSAWEYGIEPFPAYRCNLVYGRNKRDREFLPVQGVTPVTYYTVTGNMNALLYTGTEQRAAEAAKAAYDAEQESAKSWNRANLKVSLPALPEGKFLVIKTKEKGTILVVPGEDKTNKCLLFAGCAGGFRGGVGIVESGTTGTILKQCSAGNNCESSIEVIAVLEVGQSVAFHTSGRRTNEVYVHTWNGTVVETKHYSTEEWNTRNAVAAPSLDDAEVL
ncbi:MAG: hypothetical protein Q7S84_01640 [bacterium]|nr:hypothetical protein [bacterium]